MRVVLSLNHLTIIFFRSASDVRAGPSTRTGSGDSSSKNADSNNDNEPMMQCSRNEIVESNGSDEEEIFFDVDGLPETSVIPHIQAHGLMGEF